MIGIALSRVHRIPNRDAFFVRPRSVRFRRKRKDFSLSRRKKMIDALPFTLVIIAVHPARVFRKPRRFDKRFRYGTETRPIQNDSVPFAPLRKLADIAIEVSAGDGSDSIRLKQQSGKDGFLPAPPQRFLFLLPISTSSD